MLKFYTTILVIVFTSQVIAQKRLEKSMDASQIDKVIVDGDGMYKIKIITSETNTITLKATIEGETFENLLVTEKRELETITFGLDYSPFFKPENDKLAAHKVIAVELILEIPKKKIVEVVSNLASFRGEGIFKKLKVVLLEGSCSVNSFTGNGLFQTLKGDITIKATSQVMGIAISQYGSVLNELPKYGNFRIEAESKHGDIRLLQTNF
ncbi:DUF4097 family beta strand repeat-containing protein [Patiriisocius marinus]|uniref:Uncharacterized protein n=1 Tax=Patiriisocius marinus TaxID=1397112 RepID=A0A5J4IYU5_9FLAO|nr:DUF4097 family beta strand repeat-containing protein [Patiriisocius marinus]GER58808.1 hypothetical protein ULMA_09160 [Patiriisocius marinus]